MARNILRIALRALLGIVTFVVAIAAGVILHLQHPIARRVVRNELNAILKDTFQGQIQLLSLDRLSLAGVRNARATILDPDGVPVISVDRVDVDARVPSIVRNIIGGKAIVVDSIRVAGVNVLLDQTPDGQLRLAKTFLPKHPSPPSPPSSSPTLIDLNSIVVMHVWAHGNMGATPLDADLDDLHAEVHVAAATKVILQRGHVITRAMPRGANPNGNLTAQLVSDDALHVLGAFSGDIASIPASASVHLDGDAFGAIADIPTVDARRIRVLVPEAPLEQAVSAHVDATGQLSAGEDHETTAIHFAGLIGVGRGRIDTHGDFESTSQGLNLLAHVALNEIDASAFAKAAPPTSVMGNIDVTMKGSSIAAAGDLKTEGGTATFQGALDGNKASGQLDLHVQDADKLTAPFKLHPRVAGVGDLHAKGSFDTNTKQVDARLKSAFYGISRADVALGNLNLAARAVGPISNPTVTLDVNAQQIRQANMSLREADIHADGNLQGIDLSVGLVGPDRIDVDARVALLDNGVDVHRLRVTGLGQPVTGSATWNNGVGHADLRADEIDFARMGKVLGYSKKLEGHAMLATRVTVTAQSIDGFVGLDVRDFVSDQARGGLHFETTISDGTWAFQLRAHESSIGWLSAEAANLRPSGAPFSAAAWNHATGTVQVDAEGALSSIKKFAPDVKLGGYARAAMTITREQAAVAPDVTLTVATQSLALPIREGEELTKGFDVDLNAHLPPTGALIASVRSHHDSTDALIVDLKTQVAYAALLRGEIDSHAFQTTPVDVNIRATHTDLSVFCQVFESTCKGTVDLAAHVDGSVLAPRGTLHAAIAKLQGTISPVVGVVDTTMDGTFDGTNAKLKIHAATSETCVFDADANVANVMGNWVAGLAVKMNDFPLRVPPNVDGAHGHGRVTGEISLVDLHKDARVKVDLQLADVTSQGSRLDHVAVNGGFDGSNLTLSTQIIQPDGDAVFSANAKATWGAAVSPSLDASVPATFSAKTKNLRLKPLEGALSTTFEELDGRLDVDAEARIQGPKWSVRGSAAIRQGLLHSQAFGELHDLNAKVVMDEDGSLRLEQATAKGVSGELSITGHAKVQNGDIQEVVVSPHITKAHAFPLVIDGARLADIYGDVTVTMHPLGKGWNIDTNIPSFHVLLSETGERSVQKLDPDKSIRVGVEMRDDAFEVLPKVKPRKVDDVVAAAAKSRITIRLGDDVSVEQGSMLQVFITGSPTIVSGDELQMLGKLHVTRGKLDVEGKLFQIQGGGTVTFTGDPQNPTLLVTASWDAPDGSKVFADYTGPVKGGKVALRSEPAHTHDEILSLLAFGTADGMSSGGDTSSDPATKAVGTAASVATQPLNKALSQLTSADIHTRVDTSTQNPKPGVEVQISKRISAMFAVVLGVPTPGESPDLYWLTLAWRIQKRWSVQATVGDRGSSILDLVWERRY